MQCQKVEVEECEEVEEEVCEKTVECKTLYKTVCEDGECSQQLVDQCFQTGRIGSSKPRLNTELNIQNVFQTLLKL